MAGLWTQPSLEFGVKVVRVAGLDLERGGAVFVRYSVPAGDGTRRLRVDTREVPCGGGGGGEAFWGELARFERWGPGAAAGSETAAPGGGDIVFELRWRPPPSSSSGLAALLGMNSKGRRPPSRVLARAEIAWHDVAASKPAAERWLTLSPAGRELSGRKAPKLLVEVDVIRAAVAGGELKATGRKASGVDTCCSAGEYCGQCGWVGNEEDMFLAATFSQ
ncbi:hypothetical protein PR202_ga20111 [Eleusine coracana subsp. coracana]|uniref:Uncharacterized protein n=1 Tax=Eleusine coracana subsp. coracana TaxID=191504 RepID=A0AAV5CXM1_ELECO|nr:hypothetical protein QOZ80_4AG0315320 [Eleusine coracana subsp. coracana]GJN02730.1 hypothetical protein PR202_ga20111 [Eleusine coracana subsp. coracana]